MTKQKISKADLAQFTGSTQWFRHTFVRSVLYTEGAQFLAEKAGAYWLLDEIAFAQALPRLKLEEFQVWTLRMNSDQSALLICDDGNGTLLHSKAIEFSDFPFDEFSLYCTNGIILLPGEY